MNDTSVSRTLVKSTPELWAEISDLGALAEHLGEFGEIAITRIVPESTIAWEGESARGTVALEPTGWGTRVTISAHPSDEATVEVEAVPAETPISEDPPAVPPGPAPRPPARRGRLRFWRRTGPPALTADAVEPAATLPGSEPTVTEAPPTPFDRQAMAVLTGALDALGTAHHRPFSRG